MHAGREDLDVRMLGGGRPFVLEIADAHSEMPAHERLMDLQEQLKASGIGVEVLKLQAGTKSILKMIKVLICLLIIVYATFRSCLGKDTWLALGWRSHKSRQHLRASRQSKDAVLHDIAHRSCLAVRSTMLLVLL